MSIIEKARTLRAKIEGMARGLDDMEALEAPELFPQWAGSGVSYTVGDRVRYDGVLYTVLQAHTSQADWNPEAAVSLFSKVLIPDPEEIPEWEQPDSTNPYMTGDKVLFNGKTYECLMNNCVWSPADYPAAWKEMDL